jgi:hypothetical protein
MAVARSDRSQEAAMTEPSAAAEAMLQALIGEAGLGEDAAILVSQFQRAARALDRPAVAEGALFGAEPADHAATLLRLAPVSAR